MNKMMKRICLVATGLAIVLCTARCAKEKGIVANEDGLSYVTLTASKGTLTKTSLAQDSNNDLIVSWTEGDKLYAVAETDGFLGALTLEGSGGSESGTFAGNIKYVSAKQTVRFYYVGKNKSITDNNYTLDLSSQLGTLDDIVNNLHLMSGSISNVTPAMVNLGAVTMNNVVTVIKVNTKNAFGDVSDIALTGSYATGTVNLKTGTVTPHSGSINLSEDTSTECYIALLVNGDSESQTLSFTYDSKTIALDAHTILKGFFYSDNGNSIALEQLEYIDLGLPSGLLWANMNIGATAPQKAGNYYAWGETTTKTSYTWDTYSFCNGSESTMTKYNFTDHKTVLEESDDAACVLLGNGARMPTSAEWAELKANTNYTWEALNSVYGYRFTSKTDPSKSIFLPVTGQMVNSSLLVPNEGQYWASDVNTDSSWGMYCQHGYRFSFSQTTWGSYIYRYYGNAVRAVKNKDLGGYTEEGWGYGPGIEINGVVWAPVNCGVGKNYAYPYGKLYQWGRKVGGGYNDGSTYQETIIQTAEWAQTTSPDDDKFYCASIDWYSGSPSITTWPVTSTDFGYLANKIANPCPDGWRVPTVDELGSLFYTDWNSSTHTGTTKRGSWDDTNKGWDFGSSLFFKATGFRMNDGTCKNRNSYGYYWSQNSTGVGSYRYYLDIFNNYQAGMYSDGYTPYGCAVRCVQAVAPSLNTGVDSMDILDFTW